MGRRRRKSAKLSLDPIEVVIESLSHEGRGITHVNDKVVFIDGALTGEKVTFQYVSTHRNYDEGRVVDVLEPSIDRVEPKCEFYGLCGGCSIQHMSPEKQIEIKQDVLLNLFSRTSQINPQNILPALTGDYWGYRTKARLGVKYVEKKGRVIVGFREKHSPYLANMNQCEVLDIKIGHKLEVLSQAIAKMQAYNKIAQIEVATTDKVSALIFRNLIELCDEDKQILIDLGTSENYHIYLQPSGPDSVHLIHPESSELSYKLPEYGLDIKFLPTDFTQVNTSINQQMISQAIGLLELNNNDNVLDLFCGLGNFTLPIATKAGTVTGVEGDVGLIDRAKLNAENNSIANTEFHVQDLTKDVTSSRWAQKKYSKILIDPARPGAFEMMEVVAKMDPERIVYVSCNPATLARDAGVLVNDYGYQLETAGVMDMFPHTAHVESMALFVRSN